MGVSGMPAFRKLSWGEVERRVCRYLLEYHVGGGRCVIAAFEACTVLDAETFLPLIVVKLPGGFAGSTVEFVVFREKCEFVAWGVATVNRRGLIRIDLDDDAPLPEPPRRRRKYIVVVKKPIGC